MPGMHQECVLFRCINAMLGSEHSHDRSVHSMSYGVPSLQPRRELEMFPSQGWLQAGVCVPECAVLHSRMMCLGLS